MSLHPLVCLIIKKINNNKYYLRCGEIGTLRHCWWECKLMQLSWKTAWHFVKMLNIKLSYDSAILSLGI